MKSIRIITSLFLISVFSLPVHAKDLIKLDDFPAWFQESMAREKKVKKKSKLKIKEFDIKKKILGKAKLIDKSDGVWYYNIDFGSNTPVECYVFSEFDGPANSLHGIIEMGLANIEKLNKKTLSGKFNFAIDTGITESVPYLLYDTLYALGEGDKKVSGVLKALSAKTNNSLQVCLHNEVGYRETFFTIFESFVSAFSEKKENTSFFEIIFQMTLNDIPIGFAHENFTKDKDGDVEMQTEMAMIIPVDASSIARSDSVSQSWSMPNGSLINTSEYSIENGALSSSYSIEMKNEKWQVEGELQGKAIKAELKHTAPLLSGFGSYLETVRLSKSDQNSAEFDMWVSDVDPTSAMNVKISKVSDNPIANFKIDMGPLVMKILADENGIFQQSTLEQGGIKFDMKSIYVKGKPTLP